MALLHKPLRGRASHAYIGMTEKGCYLRVGSASEPMSREMIESLYGKRVRNTIGKMESPRQELSFEQLKIYYEARGLALNDAFMKNLELLTPDGKPNYAAYLLADDNGASLQVAKYSDTTRVNLIENRDFGRCSLAKALKGVLERMGVENTIFTKIGFPLRQEREMIDSIAMREAVINAIVHNDYSYGATPKFEFFLIDWRSSMGGLPYGVDEEDFFSGFSVPRNKEIMRVFRDLEIVEHLGSGIPRILKAYGKTAFEIRNSFVRVILPYAHSFEETEPASGSQPMIGQVTGQVEPCMLSVLSSCNKPRKSAEIQAIVGIHHRETFQRNYLSRLLSEGLLERTIPEKPNSRLQKYRLTQKGDALLRKDN